MASSSATSFFSKQFKRETNSEGRYVYCFSTAYRQPEDRKYDPPPLSVAGVSIPEDVPSLHEIEGLYTLPSACSNPELLQQVLQVWLDNCSSAFVSPPSLERLLQTAVSVVDPEERVYLTTEEEQAQVDWLIQWIPTRICLDRPKVIVYWGPVYKSEVTRMIPTESDGVSVKADEEAIPELQGVTQPYTTHSSTTRVIQTVAGAKGQTQNEWVQELSDLAIPLSDAPALRLDIDFSAQREKARRRVKEARIRAKLAKYRAERLAQRYEERYGLYPEEDAEEAQTEVEQSDED
jgi:hypothetical protein